MTFLLTVVLSMTGAHSPQMATNSSLVALTFGAGNAIYFSASHDEGKSFAPPVKVAETSVLPLSRHRGPRIVLTGNAIVISAVAGKTLSQGEHGLPSDGDLLVWRSVDDGKSWSKGAIVNDVPGAPTEGLHSLAAGAKGHLFAAWLDHRGKGTSLYGSRSIDGGITWSKNVLVYESPDGTICQCCHPSAMIDAAGQVLVMWRNALNGARDMYLTRSRDGESFGKPEKLGTGSWELNACPMDGGGLVLAGGRVVTAWRRDRQIFIDTPGEAETSIGEGVDVSIAGGPGGVSTLWSTAQGIVALLPGAKTPVTLAPQGKFPNVVNVRAGLTLAAWEADGKIVVQAIP
jgi:hypothetical protein